MGVYTPDEIYLSGDLLEELFLGGGSGSEGEVSLVGEVELGLEPVTPVDSRLEKVYCSEVFVAGIGKFGPETGALIAKALEEILEATMTSEGFNRGYGLGSLGRGGDFLDFDDIGFGWLRLVPEH